MAWRGGPAVIGRLRPVGSSVGASLIEASTKVPSCTRKEVNENLENRPYRLRMQILRTVSTMLSGLSAEDIQPDKSLHLVLLPIQKLVNGLVKRTKEEKK